MKKSLIGLACFFSLIILSVFIFRNAIHTWWLNITDYYPPGHLVSGLEKGINEEHTFSFVEEAGYILVKDDTDPPSIPMMWLAPKTNPEVRNYIGKKVTIEKASILSPQQIEDYPKVFYHDPNYSNDFSAVVVQVDIFTPIDE